MHKKLLIAAGFALAAATLAGQAPAQAQNAPWCASPYLSGGAQMCNFVTIQQCQAYLQGITGQCNPNYRLYSDASGYYAPAPAYDVAPRPRRHR